MQTNPGKLLFCKRRYDNLFFLHACFFSLKSDKLSAIYFYRQTYTPLYYILKRGQRKPGFMKKFYWNFLKPFVCHLRILRAINISYTQYKLIPSSRSWLPIQTFGKSKPIKVIRYESKILLVLQPFELFENYATLVHQLLYPKLASMCWLLMMAFGPERAV